MCEKIRSIYPDIGAHNTFFGKPRQPCVYSLRKLFQYISPLTYACITSVSRSRKVLSWTTYEMD
ncbi:MAG: hypothetical protein HWN68_10215 [Desulfobacterales bacterium]|nr:hypothetical protein [Desulfobacterales bacterium]